MNDWISRQAAIEALDAVPYDDMLSDEGSVGESFRAKKDKTAIESVPLADVEPVVRCKDCVHYKGDYCRNYGGIAYARFVRMTDFCSLGARMDGGEQDG